MIGSASFESLTELVQYYESNPLYRRMKLKYAINEDVLKSIGEVSNCTMLLISHLSLPLLSLSLCPFVSACAMVPLSQAFLQLT